MYSVLEVEHVRVSQNLTNLGGQDPCKISFGIPRNS